ncbi:FtsX-like permease family protein [Alteromonas sp. BMJM2]|uniref:ABC transporter permease n=1 Tax=Alteromonas sp. BMJM2 TaxID=2954241 RepID=UPI003FA4266B
MSRVRPWEPLLIMFAIILANAGLITVLLINEGASQGELASSQSSIFNGGTIVFVDKAAMSNRAVDEAASAPQIGKVGEVGKDDSLSKADYAKLRMAGFTQLVAFSQREQRFSCAEGGNSDNQVETSQAASELSLLGIDNQALFSYPVAGDKAGSISNSMAGLMSANGGSAEPHHVVGAIHPATKSKLGCDVLFFSSSQKGNKKGSQKGSQKLSQKGSQKNSQLVRDDKQDGKVSSSGVSSLGASSSGASSAAALPTGPAEAGAKTAGALPPSSDITSTSSSSSATIVQLSVSTAVPQDTIVVSLADFYRRNITEATWPLSGFLSLLPLSQNEKLDIQQRLSQTVAFEDVSTQQDTGSLPDSFKLNLWAMGALMAVVALFIVLNALNLMYRTRLPNIIRMRQLGISSRYVTTALLIELLLYCVFSVPIGCAAGFYAASMLSPIISGTFSSLFNAVFITPDVNLISTLALSVFVTFLSLGIFALIPAKQLSTALSTSKVKAAQPMRKRSVLVWTIAGIALLAITQALISTTLHALLFVALLLLVSCSLVIIWLPILANGVMKVTPPSKPVLHFIVASTAQLSSRTRLAVCAFFIALTANIGMNVMTDSFRAATESWLTQRLYAPAYLYTDKALSELVIPEGVASTPLLRLQGKLVAQSNTIGNDFSSSDSSSNDFSSRDFKSADATTVSISSYPTHDNGRNALVVDSSVPNAWAKFESGEGIYINQQLAFSNDVSLGDTLFLEEMKAANIDESSKKHNNSFFNKPPSFTVLGIYPDYGNIKTQLLLPLSSFNRDTIGDAAFSGVLAISYGQSTFPANTPEAPQTFEQKEATLATQGNLYSREELLTLSMDTFDRTFVLTDGLNITTLLVAGIAFAVSLSILSLSNASSLTVLRALGVSKAAVKLSLLGQYIFLCLLTALLAVPFGVYLAYVFIFKVNRLAFSWVYPLAVDVGVIVSSVTVSLAIICLVIALPLGRLKPKVDLRQDAPL